jgi:hypothetical protein
MLSFYILCSESLVEVDWLIVEFEGIDNKSKVEVVWTRKDEFKDIKRKSKVDMVLLGKFEVE